MKRRTFVLSIMAGVLTLPIGVSLAADQDRIQDRDQTRDQEQLQDQQQIYGSQLMTQQERTEYRRKMRTAKSDEERERIRAEHHERMQERANAQGTTIPAMPPARGGMMDGSGMGPGGQGR